MRQVWERILRSLHKPDVAIFHHFRRPPYGGSNQFLLALREELRCRGLRVGANVISATTRACVLNSFAFDHQRLLRMKQAHCRVVHRVDGPVSVYRGVEDGTDQQIYAINQESVDLTVFQSHYSLNAHRALGIELKAPVVIMNAADSRIFFRADQPSDLCSRKVRLISSSWSNNLNKGAKTYQWLDDHLDWNRFEYTFVGRSPVTFGRIRMIPAVSSHELAHLLRQHDIYITASLYDPCSNALIEALSCGLPAIYADSGGHPEIVGQAGFGFSSQEEIPPLLDRLVDEYESRRDQISLHTLAHVTDQYISVLGVADLCLNG